MNVSPLLPTYTIQFSQLNDKMRPTFTQVFLERKCSWNGTERKRERGISNRKRKKGKTKLLKKEKLLGRGKGEKECEMRNM